MITVGQLYAAMMVPTAVILLGVVLDVLAWRRLNATFDRLDAGIDRMRSFKL
jgi:hypothetical protein